MRMSTVNLLIDRYRTQLSSAAPGREAGDALTTTSVRVEASPPGHHDPDSFPRRRLRAEEMVRPRRILIAEDEHLVALSLSLSLTDAGYTIIGPATDGEQAVELARRMLPDMALLDIRMPRRSGIEAAHEIFGALGIPVVIVSAHSDAPLANAAADAGVFGYIVKPASTEQLRAALTVAWGRFCEYAESERATEELRRRLEERRTIEQAKWMLVERHDISESQALEELRSRARGARRPMIDVAIEILRETKN
jgi:AmiR/NasT family two-component response regulator